MTSIAKTQKTYCRICEAACGLEVDFNDLGEAVRIRPDKNHPNSKGFACGKGTRFLETNFSSDRLLYPQARQPDGSFKRISWDEAYRRIRTHIAPIIKRYGPHAVGFYFGNPLAFNAGAALVGYAFQQALGSRNVYSAGSQDCNNKFSGSYIVHGSSLIHPLPDYQHCELAILFGTNPAISQGSFIHLEGGSMVFDHLKARGARVVVVDPRRTESAKRWATGEGDYLAIRPGTDLFLLLALLQQTPIHPNEARYADGLDALRKLAADYTPERAAQLTGINAQAIYALAKAITSQRTAMHMSVGVNQGPFGTLCYVTLQALMLASGNMDRQGGNLFHPLAVKFAPRLKNGGFGPLDLRSRVGNYPAVMGTMPGGIMADEIEQAGDERIRALICIAGDPLRSIPGSERLAKAFEKLDFLVAIDTFASRTTTKAHLVLPGTSWLERFDYATTTTIFQFSPALQYAGPLLKAPSECRHDGRILCELSNAIGRPVFGSKFLAKSLGLALEAGGTGFATLTKFMRRLGFAMESGTTKMPAPKPGSYLGQGPNTPGHQLRFWHPWLEAEVDRVQVWLAQMQQRQAGYTLVCRRRRLGHNSWLQGATRSGDPEQMAWLHSSDYTKLGLNGKHSQIQIESSAGKLRIAVAPNDDVTPGTVVVPHGLHHADVNAIIPSGANSGNIEPLGGMLLMTGIPVNLQAA